LDCHFNELTIDHRHVKYQSAANTSLYLGFDSKGKPVCGRSSDQIQSPNDETSSLANVTSSHPTTTATGAYVSRAPAEQGAQPANSTGAETTSMQQAVVTAPSLDGCERCYLFTKSNRLQTDTNSFPKALELIANGHNATSYRTAGSSANSTLLASMYETVAAELAKKRATSALAGHHHSFEQGQLINMERYRNILRYKLGRSAGQSIVSDGELDESLAAPNQGDPAGTVGAGSRLTGSKIMAAVRGRQAGQKRRKTSSRTKTSASKGKRQATAAATMKGRRPADVSSSSGRDETTCEDSDTATFE
jgi:hypothetical protein